VHIVIGAKRESDFTDPIGMLGDCHRRIERFLDVLVRVAEQAHGEALNEEQRGALDTALHYFRDAAPKHTADEKESRFPACAGTGALTRRRCWREWSPWKKSTCARQKPRRGGQFGPVVAEGWKAAAGTVLAASDGAYPIAGTVLTAPP
jgi:hypothetical protein